MTNWKSLALALSLMTCGAWAGSISQDVLEETIYQNFKDQIVNKDAKKTNIGFSRFEQSLFVDALWDLTEEAGPEHIDTIDDVQTFHYDVQERLRIAILRLKYNRMSSLSKELLSELEGVLKSPEVNIKMIYTIAAYQEELLRAGHGELIKLAKNHAAYLDISHDQGQRREIDNDIVSDLFHHTPDVNTYMNGEYARSVKLFMFCRENRLYPCLMVMKNAHGEVLRNSDGTIWTHPFLASSARGLPSYIRNGNTPAGIMTIDSVMPWADQQISFGKFRRLIINFIPKSRNEIHSKALLPSSSHNSYWWKPGTVARDAGRNLFRIHGTGRINRDPSTSYYPFVRTSGCIAQLENTYDGIEYRDQRILLDEVMKALDLAPTFQNEVRIKGILYLLDIDDHSGPVTAEELAIRGIE